jgi:CRP-like cAMP-binding protein
MAETVEEKIRSFFTKYPKRSYPKGQILLFADEKPSHVFFLSSGKVRKYSITDNGDEVIINIFKKGSFFPMSYAINGTKNSFFYKTETETEVHVVPPRDALQFIKDNPDVILDLLSRIYRGIDGMYGRLVHLMSGSARSRLAYELVIEARRFGQTDSTGKISLEVNEVDLAARTGLSRETVSREIQKLKENNLVNLTGKVLIINNLVDLQALSAI